MQRPALYFEANSRLQADVTMKLNVELIVELIVWHSAPLHDRRQAEQEERLSGEICLLAFSNSKRLLIVQLHQVVETLLILGRYIETNVTALEIVGSQECTP